MSNSQQSTPPFKEWKSVNVYGTDFRPSLKDMADTIDRLELWDWFKNEKPPPNEGYMFWGHKNVNAISDGLNNNQHSGATFGFAMRCMQSIAKLGFEDWNKVPE
jgi:hypothetical protein